MFKSNTRTKTTRRGLLKPRDFNIEDFNIESRRKEVFILKHEAYNTTTKDRQVRRERCGCGFRESWRPSEDTEYSIKYKIQAMVEVKRKRDVGDRRRPTIGLQNTHSYYISYCLVSQEGKNYRYTVISK